MRKSILFSLSLLSLLPSCKPSFSVIERSQTNSAVNQELFALPQSYYESESSQPGNVIDFSYESYDYVLNQPLNEEKHCMVYLPFGYDETKAYEILYMMHGWHSDIHLLLEEGKLKNLFDIMIQKKLMKEMIVVFPSYTPHHETDISAVDSFSYIRKFDLEFREKLMPAVESKYHTYADFKVDEESLSSSKFHRGFGGFSMGGVTTWYELLKNNRYLFSFIPMAMDFWNEDVFEGTDENTARNNAVYLEQSLEKQNVTNTDFRVYGFTGTNDSYFEETDNFLSELKKENLFSEDNTLYSVYQGGYHDYDALRIYAFNALLKFYSLEATV